ncbi:hypothetical protein B0F90DRAFT_993756 [Multifurca ochricompacta]|uniref:Crinkler effector protein N-terminal domain-containing protein n=1 Tax=Multifurca ochricompacta TaxID=376703 RepID=A0AAD4LU18_9AGAM|nr:hypothetical protein B0F90DRAFT_993756 [Multifurca ochricompacta]
MATTLTLFCIAVDNRKVPLGDIFDVEIQANSFVTRLKEAIKAKKANQFSHLDADQLTLWKLLTPPDIESIEDEDSFDKTIQDFELPPPKSKEAFQGNSDVQALGSAKKLSAYWENSPEEGHLHILVQVPCKSPFLLDSHMCLTIIQLSYYPIYQVISPSPWTHPHIHLQLSYLPSTHRKCHFRETPSRFP